MRLPIVAGETVRVESGPGSLAHRLRSSRRCPAKNRFRGGRESAGESALFKQSPRELGDEGVLNT